LPPATYLQDISDGFDVVRFTPESGHSGGYHKTSAFDPKRTFKRERNGGTRRKGLP